MLLDLLSWLVQAGVFPGGFRADHRLTDNRHRRRRPAFEAFAARRNLRVWSNTIAHEWMFHPTWHARGRVVEGDIEFDLSIDLVLGPAGRGPTVDIVATGTPRRPQMAESVVVRMDEPRDFQAHHLDELTAQVARRIRERLRPDWQLPTLADAEATAPSFGFVRTTASPVAEHVDEGGTPTTSPLLDGMLRDLETQGHAEGRGRFTLDQSVAARKFQDAQPPSPDSFAVDVCRALALRGASRIDVTRHQRSSVITFSATGPDFAPEELRDFERALLAPDGSAEMAATARLATALLSLARLRPRGITIASKRGGKLHGVRVIPHARNVSREATPRELASASEVEPTATCWFRVEFGWRPGGGDPLHGPMKELLDRAVFSPIQIVVDTFRVPRSFEDHTTLGHTHRKLAGLSIEAGLVGHATHPARLLVEVDGLILETVDLDPNKAPAGFLALATADDLRTDLTGQRFVQDQAFERLEANALDMVCDVALEICRDPDDPHAQVTIRQFAAALLDRADADEDVRRAVLQAPVWPTVTGTFRSTEELRQRRDEHGLACVQLCAVGYTPVSRLAIHDALDAPVWTIVLDALGPNDRNTLTRIGHGRISNETARLIRMAERGEL